ncbi:MAG: Glycosyl transferase family 2 [Candidatus Woesebacteria bacterium GW2011_GWA1_37_8]|uniref:Glycosyl transferase family 2 n=2 Tax=Candidatus Woeseibacteriota TaxID=1752722 RepID=A0A0G0PCS5_9BACT|nr:MAG: Glycosyl transferase family 2 [Microgenomates group bacterium GW2011_GWC1_37_12b]KKQ44580.1 MAG: Glycosyl transferase family 2 [Candidatus Woesebacteria bacterium GW2011_GWA1_37_8]KKQ87081.1 MAG: Glycosyl transferase family 2 [Candidatus Woesebacteria bacterium GW2011_GWB1_38_8b]
MKQPLVSFVIRTKNEQKYIAKVVNLLYSQSYENIEIIVVDSGSKDETIPIVKKLPVKLIQIKPEEFTYGHALNVGIDEAKGKTIGIVSGHSIPINNEWLENGLKHFDNVKVAAVTGPYSENPLGYENQTAYKNDPALVGRIQHRYKYLTNTNSLIRKSLWNDYKFDEKLAECEDYDWAAEMLSRGFDVVKDPKFGVFHCHSLLGRPGYWERIKGWDKITKEIDLKRSKLK